MKGDKISIETSVYQSYSTENTFRDISDVGYEFVEISPYHFVRFRDRSKRSQLKKLLRSISLEPCSLLVTWLFLGVLGGNRRRHVKEMENCIELANSIGCDMITCASGMRGDNAKKRDHITAFKKSILELLPVLERNNVRILFECHPGDFFNNAIEAIDMLRRFDRTEIGYLYCIPHSFLFDIENIRTIEYAQDLLGHVHVADTNRPKENDHQHLIPGLGEVDFEEVFKDLATIGYDGFYSSAPFTHKDDPTEAALATKNRIEALLQEQRKARRS